jgi:hypothetical protein
MVPHEILATLWTLALGRINTMRFKKIVLK